MPRRSKKIFKPTEHSTQTAILEYLGRRGIFAWRNNSGAMPIDAPGGRRFVRFGVKGSPDIMGVLSGGQFLGIEVKGPKGKVSPAQDEFLTRIRNAGGVAIVAFSVDDVMRLI